jgi:hypothetical protein
MLSAAKHLAADRDRPFAEFILSEENLLRVTVEVPIYRAHRRLIGPQWVFLLSGLFFETPLSALDGCSDIQINTSKFIWRER